MIMNKEKVLKAVSIAYDAIQIAFEEEFSDNDKDFAIHELCAAASNQLWAIKRVITSIDE